MAVKDSLKQLFPGLSLSIEDIYRLESFQMRYWPQYIPRESLGSILRARPEVKAFILSKCPDLTEFIDRVERAGISEGNFDDLDAAADDFLWTIADHIVYTKCPEVYDRLPMHGWDIREVLSLCDTSGRTIIDSGAGTGKITAAIAPEAKAVFAVEPVSRMREYLREKLRRLNIGNAFVVDGYNHCLPFPDDFADLLITSHAIGWDIEKELPEFERVVRPGGIIVHCPASTKKEGDSPTHVALVSEEWGYAVAEYESVGSIKRKYWKKVSDPFD